MRIEKKVFLIFFLIFFLETIYFSIENRNLKSQIRNLRLLLSNTSFNLSNGEYFPDVSLINLEGNREKIFNKYENRELLLIIFSIDCDSCIQMIKKINKIHEEHNSRYKILGISTASIEKTREFIKKNLVIIPVYCLEEKESNKLEIPSFPMTLLILPDRRIIQSIIGEFNDSFLQSLE
jgi:peroxiredoxin